MLAFRIPPIHRVRRCPSELRVKRARIHLAQLIFLEYHPLSSNIIRCQIQERVWFYDLAEITAETDETVLTTFLQNPGTTGPILTELVSN